jgi:dolichyl-phosphate-mannose-protein mannosyltransferase
VTSADRGVCLPEHRSASPTLAGMRHRVPAWVVPAVVTLAAALLLFVRLGTPADIIFDEVYYVEDARNVLEQGVESGFAVHPPVGKWFIAAGIALLGDTPAGWRAAGALAGALTVLLTVLLARRLTGRTLLGVLAGGLLALDGVFLVQARTAMLDVFLVAFVVLGAYLLVVDRQRRRTDRATSSLGSRWALVLAGVAFGAGVATKWSGVLALLAAGVLVAVWESTDRRRSSGRPDGTTEAGQEAPAPATVASGARRAASAVVLGLAVPALAVYALSWTPWLLQFESTRTGQVRCEEQPAEGCRFGPVDRLSGLVDHHRDVVRFHLALDAEHPYRAPATTWPVQARPVVFHWENCGVDDDPATCAVAPGNAAEIVALGNPVLWWGGLLLLPVLLAGGVRRDRRSAVPLAFLAAQYLPWLVVARPVFSFYAVPLVPFLTVGVAVACDTLDRPQRWLCTASGTVLGGAAGALVAALSGVGRTGVGTAAGVTALAGAAVGAVFDARRPPLPAARSGPLGGSALGRMPSALDDVAGRRVGSYVAAAFGLLAVVAAIYFAPLWLAIELPEEAIRQRWWFEGWV